MSIGATAPIKQSWRVVKQFREQSLLVSPLPRESMPSTISIPGCCWIKLMML